jgi:cyanophycin synthetase
LIETKSRFEQSARQALQKSKRIIIESHLTGHDYRLLATPKRLIHAVKRIPARVFGDGKATVKQLINKENSNPWRGERFRQELVRIKFDEESKYILHKQRKNINSIPANGEEIILKNCCNQCKGGEVETVLNVHPEFTQIATAAAKALEVPLAGVDLMAKDITVPVKQGGGKIIEVNENPGIQIHQIPTHGQGINVAKIILELLFNKKF